MMTAEMVYGSVDAMLERVAAGRPVRRTALAKNADSLSGSPFESVLIGHERHVLKRLGRSVDWVMRALGDGAGDRPPWVVLMWESGLLRRLPAQLDHTVVAAAWEPATGVAALLMRDVAGAFVPPGDSTVDLAAHRRFLAHMAALHAAFWGFDDEVGLAPPAARYRALTPATAAREAAAGGTDAVPRAIPGGWAALAAAAPAAHGVALAFATDPAPLVHALAGTPATLVHGDWKFGNLGSLDGRTVLVDWAWPGRAAACVDLAWYLAVNCDRLPESKEDAIAAYRAALTAALGTSVADWFDRQLELALLGGFVQLGWSKAGPELDWWVRRVLPVGRELLR